MIKKLIFVSVLYLIVFAAFARDINVKYRNGAIDVDNGSFVELQLKDSSLVKEIFYDQANKYLLVRLQHTFYHYCSIPASVVDSWVSSPSLGKYYNANVEGNYDCRIYPTPEYKQSELQAEEDVDKKIFVLAMENIAHESAECNAYYQYTSAIMERDHPNKVETIANSKSSADQFLEMGIFAAKAAGRPEDKAFSIFASRFKMALEEQKELVENYGWSALVKRTGLRCKEILENPQANIDGWDKKIRERFE